MTNQEAIEALYSTKEAYILNINGKPTICYSSKRIEACEMAIKAMSVDYEGMAEELSKFSGIGGLSKKGISEIIKKYVENKEE